MLYLITCLYGSLGTDGKWFKLKPSTTLSSKLKPLVIEDKFFEQRKAFAEGKTIQYKACTTDIWYYVKNPDWDINYEYRVKPEEKEKLWFWKHHLMDGRICINTCMITEEKAIELYINPTKLEALGFEYKED